MQLWEAVGITPDWPGHETTDASAAAILQQAAQFESYTIANMGTCLAHRERVAGAQAQKAQQFLDYLLPAPDRA